MKKKKKENLTEIGGYVVSRMWDMCARSERINSRIPKVSSAASIDWALNLLFMCVYIISTSFHWHLRGGRYLFNDGNSIEYFTEARETERKMHGPRQSFISLRSSCTLHFSLVIPSLIGSIADPPNVFTLVIYAGNKIVSNHSFADIINGF